VVDPDDEAVSVSTQDSATIDDTEGAPETTPPSAPSVQPGTQRKRRRRYLLSMVIFGHFSTRLSVAANMTVNEFAKARNASDGRVVVLVSEHKTSAQGPAQPALEVNHHRLFSLFLKRLTFVNKYCIYLI